MMLQERASIENITLDGGPWNLYTEAGRQVDVQRCEIIVNVPDIATRVMITRNLRYKAKFIGRGLKQNLVLQDGTETIHLMKGDRLEPSLAMRDVSDFESRIPPFSVEFWRMFPEDRLVHNSPLFMIPGLGIDTHGPDTLHQWCLGPVCNFIPLALWFLVGSSVYSPAIDYLSTEGCAKIALMRIKKTNFGSTTVSNAPRRGGVKKVAKFGT
jgi:hypothetical protein